VVEASFDAVALRQATFGWKCKSCGHITEAESEAIRPKYCPSCGHQYFNVCRIVTEKE
jgi:rubrerythrin